MTTQADLKKVRVSMMNAVHDLAVLVARDEGLFNEQGLDVEVVTTPGTAQVGADRQAMRDVIFDRTMESLYNTRRRRPVPHVRVGHHEADGGGGGRGVPLGQDRGTGLGDVHLRHHHAAQQRLLRAGAVQGRAHRRQPLQRLALHHAKAPRGLRGQGARSRSPTRARWRSGCRPSGAATWPRGRSWSRGSAWRRSRGSASSWRATRPAARPRATSWTGRRWPRCSARRPPPPR